MKKIFTLFIAFILLVSSVFGYSSNNNFKNDKINLLSTEDPENEIRNYTFYAIMKYMGFNIPSGSILNYPIINNSGNSIHRNTLLVNALDGFNKYSYAYFGGVGLENVNSQYKIDYNNMSQTDILRFEKEILNQLNYYIVNDNKLVVVDDNYFILNNLGSYNFEIFDRNVTITNTFTPTGSSFQIQNRSITKSNNLKYIKYITKVNGWNTIMIPVASNNLGGVSAPILTDASYISFGKYVQTYANGTYSTTYTAFRSILDVNNSSNIQVRFLALDNNTANNLMYNQFPVNQTNNDVYYCHNDSTKKCLLALQGNSQNSVNYIYTDRSAIISSNQLNELYTYGYYGLNEINVLDSYKLVTQALSEDYGITDINNFVSNTNIVNMSDSELLNLIPKDTNGNLDLSELRTLAPTLNDLLELPNNQMPNYNGGSSSGGGGSEEPTPSTPSDTNYDYGLSDGQVEILNENTALGTIGKILAKGFEFVATPLAKGLQGLTDWFKKLVGATEEAPQTIWNFFSSGFNLLKNGLDSITQSVSNIASDLWSAFQSGFNSISGFIEDVADGLQSQINVLTQGLSDIADAIGNITQNIVTNITNVFSDVVDAINGLALGFWDYFKNGFQWVKNSIDALTLQVLASLTNLGSVISNALSNIWNGFINLFTIPTGDTFINDELSDLNDLVSNKWNFDDLTGFLNTIKNGSVQNDVLNDEYINLPNLLGGNSAKIIDYSFIRNNIETIRNLQRFVLYSALALNIKDCISGVIRNDT